LLPASGIKDIQAYMHEYDLQSAVVAVPSNASACEVETLTGRGYTVTGVAVSSDGAEESVRELRSCLESCWNDKLAMKRNVEAGDRT
jgi:hypothetical protein